MRMRQRWRPSAERLCGAATGARKLAVQAWLSRLEREAPVRRQARPSGNLPQGKLRYRQQTRREPGQAARQSRARSVRREHSGWAGFGAAEVGAGHAAGGATGLATVPGRKLSPNEDSRSETNSFRTLGSGSGSGEARTGPRVQARASSGLRRRRDVVCDDRRLGATTRALRRQALRPRQQLRRPELPRLPLRWSGYRRR